MDDVTLTEVIAKGSDVVDSTVHYSSGTLVKKNSMNINFQ